MLPKDAPVRGFIRMINWTIEQIRMRGQWSFDFDRGVIDVPAAYDTGTVEVTNGDATVVGTDTLWAANAAAGRTIRIGNVEYLIASVTDDTNLELTEAFGGTSESGLSYAIYQDEFDLEANVQTVRRVWDQTNRCELIASDPLSIKSRTTAWKGFGWPTWYALLKSTLSIPRHTDGVSSTVKRILIGPPPSSYARFEYYFEKGIDKVTIAGDEIDLPHELDELVIQGVYSRALEIARIPDWQGARAEFQRMLEDRWTKDRTTLDVKVRNRRADGDFWYPVPMIEPRRSVPIQDA